MKCFVSFCNQHWPRTHTAFLAAIDLSTNDVNAISLPEEIASRCGGITGLAAYGDGFVCLLQPNLLGFLTLEGEVRSIRTVDSVADGHSVCAFEDSVLIACSRTNSIVRVWGGRCETVWTSGHGDRDAIHVNSVAVHRESVYVTGFGESPGDSWLHARDGWIRNISTGEVIQTGLYHPHSLGFVDGSWWVCESLRGCVVGAEGRIPISMGYVRGLAFYNGAVIVGSSHFRLRSRSTGRAIPTPGDLCLGANTAGITVIHRATPVDACGRSRFIDLSAIGNEIYDVVVVN